MITSKRPGPAIPSEAQCQSTIVAAAKRCGWLVHAEPPSRRPSGSYSTLTQGHNGWPDLILVRGGRILAIELKRHGNHATEAQLVWLLALSVAGVDARVLYVPERMQELLEELAT